MTLAKPTTIDEYIALYPEETQEALQLVRATIQKVAPEAVETISYAIPAFSLFGRYLVYFAAFKNHIGFYALPTSNEVFKEELSAYKVGKGSIQFPLNEPMPVDLITKLVEFRIKENQEKMKTKKQG